VSPRKLARLTPFTVFAILGCAVPKEAGFPEVAAAVEARVGARVVWDRGGAEDAEVKKSVAALLARELTEDAAVQIALLNNKHLQATYEDLMVAQADVVQAGLLKNPVFFGSARLPLGPGLSNLEAGVEQDFLDLLLIPARRRVAETSFAAVKLRVGGEVVALAAEVRGAFYALQGAIQVAAMRRAIGEAADASVDLARRQHEAGNISDLDLANEESQFTQTRLDLARSEAEILGARERLARLLGVYGEGAAFRVADKLPELPAEDPPLEHVESLAVARRLDIAAARKDVEAVARGLSLLRSFRFIGGASVGVSAERHVEGQIVVGPTASLELPIFDQKQAALASMEAELRRRQRRLDALAVDARSEVREARGRVLFARSVARHYHDVIVPLRERIVALSQKQYDAMLLGVYQLLLAKQGEVAAYREYIDAVREYWVARVELERAAGGRLPTAKLSPKAASPKPAPSPPTSTPNPSPQTRTER
jgi:outer membrane protein, heavy metal efflux system